MTGEAADSDRLAILLDCVFGLEQNAWPRHMPPGLNTLWQLFRRAAQEGQGYGLKPAAAFFAKILEESTARGFPVRHCEVLANANSVFRTHPFQKNIQCGTYRIWRDLGQSPEPWLNIRYFTPAREVRHKPWLYEAYPSLIWREHFQLRTRNLAELPGAMKRVLPEIRLSREDAELIARHPDYADAAVLAMGGFLLDRAGLLKPKLSRNQRLAREGWIVGLKKQKVDPEGPTSETQA